MAGRSLTIDINTQDAQTLAALKRLQREFRDLDGTIDRTSRQGLSLGQSLGGLALGAGAIFSINEFEEAEKGMRATEAVIKSTGNAAEVSAEQQAQLVDELSRLAGVDDDVVNSGANMLRTFTQIKGENFGVALAASMDLAAFKGQDLATTAEQVGKALNDPVAGMGKLAKQGVVLSEVQKQQIRDFAAVGDIASAQGVILQELETEYGGQAEAAATSSGKMKVAFGEAAESVGQVLAPAMEVGADVAGKAAAAFGSLPAPLQAATVGALGLAYAGPKVVDGLSRIPETLNTVGDALGTMKGKGADAASTATSFIGSIGPGGVAAGVAGLGLIAAAYTQIQVEQEHLKQNAKELQQSLEDGLSPTDAVATRLANTLAGLDGGFEGLEGSSAGFREQLDLLGLSATEAVKLIAGSKDEWQAWVDDMSEGDPNFQRSSLFQNLEMMREAINKGADAEKIRKEVTKELGVETDKTADKTQKATEKTKENADAQVGWLGSIGDSTTAWNDQATAIQDVNEKLDENRAKAGDAFDAESAYQSSLFGLEDAQGALKEALESGDADKVARAQQALYDAIVNVSEAKVTLAEKEAEARGETLSAADAADIQRGALISLVDQTGVTNGSIDTLIDRLTLAAARRTIELDTLEAEANLDKLIAKLTEALAAFEAIGAVFGVGGDLVANGVAEILGALNPPEPQGGNVRTANARGNVIVQGDLHVGGPAGMRDLEMAMNRRNDAEVLEVLAS